MKQILFTGCILILIILMSTGTVVYADDLKTITDMCGREVTIPAEIKTVLATNPPITDATFMISPDVLIGMNSDFNKTKYMSDKYKSLPNVGGQQAGNTLNYETFLSMKPDVILFAYTPGINPNTKIEELEQKLYPIPVVAISDATDVLTYTPEIEFLGKLFRKEDQAANLIRTYNEIFQKVNSTVKNIPIDKRVRVYYAEGPDGLKTDPAGTACAQLITICGGENVATVPPKGQGGMSPVSMESVASWNPEVILAGDTAFYKSVYSDPNWQNIDAVKNKRVYMIPNQPFGWIDRPPGINRIVGIPWLAKALYPDLFNDIDLASYIKQFYSSFFHYNLTDDEINTIISSSGL